MYLLGRRIFKTESERTEQCIYLKTIFKRVDKR